MNYRAFFGIFAALPTLALAGGGDHLPSAPCIWEKIGSLAQCESVESYSWNGNPDVISFDMYKVHQEPEYDGKCDVANQKFLVANFKVWQTEDKFSDVGGDTLKIQRDSFDQPKLIDTELRRPNIGTRTLVHSFQFDDETGTSAKLSLTFYRQSSYDQKTGKITHAPVEKINRAYSCRF